MKKLAHMLSLMPHVRIDGVTLALSILMGALPLRRQQIKHFVHNFVRLSAPSAEPEHNIVYEMFYQVGLDSPGEVREQGEQTRCCLRDPRKLEAARTRLTNGHHQ
ncbi:hypothetical protein SAMN05444389_101420 [Paracoccus solventivorans]|uniref:Uncharacterized protein n=1 Tax=Paracoccus solventivorans TaxID=53463 RepID=A0A1M7DKU9_9RHOB|nr:hypothetical protein SAMN05444389_101420 [Paracoccus solventivorans]